MSTATPSRPHWLLLSFLLFTGIFVGRTAGRVNQGAHIPVRAACRAMGASASLSSATRNLSSDQKNLSASSLSTILVLFLLSFAVPHRTAFEWHLTRTPHRLLPAISLPPLLFRPPPVSIVA